MTDAKPFASLSSSLLARKGHARPAMRPQSMLLNNGASQSLEDLGWNDLGDDDDTQHKAHLATVSTLTPMAAGALTQLAASPVQQQAQIVRAFEDAEYEEAEAEAWDQVDLHQLESFQPQPMSTPAVELPVAPELAAPELAAPEPAAPIIDVLPIAPASNLRAAPGTKGKAAFTLRLDPDRHMRLRLWVAVSHRSAQQIVTQALDEFLDRHAAANPFNPPVSAA